MLFSSLIFLWFFLPAVFLLSLCLGDLRWKNGLLLCASLLFYGWGEPKYVVLMVISIALNYGFGLFVWEKKGVLALAVAVNLGLLGYFKYYSFLGNILQAVFGQAVLPVREIALPVGISFYTFQALSYVIDVWRGTIKPQKNPWKLALYISFFPQLIAGPIVKYRDIEKQLDERTVTAKECGFGVRRFTCGLAKKVLFANVFAAVVDQALGPARIGGLDREMILLAVLLYTLQIYYDFSGYSDMAIGLGQMFGFRFPENFNYPYLSASIREFWRRWHISLSTWFREYLYIPLGGNRKGAVRTYLNLFLVFLTTGLWHGAGMNFVLWGAYHGVFLVAERLFLGDLLERLKKHGLGFVGHAYALVVVFFGWLIFRVESMWQLKLLLSKLLNGENGYYSAALFMDRRLWFWLVLGLLFCGPVQRLFMSIPGWRERKERLAWSDIAVTAVLLFFCIMLLVNNTYNPFIYFRF